MEKALFCYAFLRRNFGSFSLINLKSISPKPKYNATENNALSEPTTKKVKLFPMTGRSSFSSNIPNKRVGKQSRQQDDRYFRYLGLILQVLLISIRLNTVVIPYTKVKPTSSA